ncbi:hypothetical protein B7494_g482 [Chlorociboria aeruginascens]|nr:hypothetical protein B7494_g482 [Chlorociboria aeruginascens]
MPKNPRYDWPAHLPKMVELWKQNMSIPAIHKAIQNEAEGFTPKMVYKKFMLEGYPTEPKARAKVLSQLSIAAWPSGIPLDNQANCNIISLPSVPTLSSNDRQDIAQQFHNTSDDGMSDTYPDYPIDSQWRAELSMRSSQSSSNSTRIPQRPNETSFLDLHADTIWEEDAPPGEQVLNPIEYKEVPSGTPSESNTDNDRMNVGPPSSTHDYPIRLDTPTTSVDDWNRFQSPHRVDTPSPTMQRTSSQRSVTSNPASSNVKGRLASLPKSKQRYHRSFTPENRNSTATNDSGYASGRNTPLLFPSPDVHSPHPQSLEEFNGLYRVPCSTLHQPRGRFKDIPTCTQCKYSPMHNLSWSGRLMEFQVFQAELKRQVTRDLEMIGDPSVVDAAGNNALHFAAAGGAGFDHFLALIAVGVDPSQINTAGQSFLHCLRPYIRKSESEPCDMNLVTQFHADLINTLNKQPEIARLESRRSCSSKTQAMSPVDFPIYHLRILYISRENFARNQERESKAWELLGRASNDPQYVDETGDNVLHALSRLRLSSPKALLAEIHKFTSKDIDLNLHNREFDSPLVAFIHQRPCHGVEGSETGATLSKYLDSLLWKDERKRVMNKINVNLRNLEGRTALFYAAIRGRPDSVRSLAEAGANVNALDGEGMSILQAALNAKTEAVLKNDMIKINLLANTISYLEHYGAVENPTLMQERALYGFAVRRMPL